MEDAMCKHGDGKLHDLFQKLLKKFNTTEHNIQVEGWPETKPERGTGVRSKKGLCAKLRNFNFKAMEHVWILPGKWDLRYHSGTLVPGDGSGYGWSETSP